MTRIATVITCCDSPPLAEEATYYARENSTKGLNEIILVDNGSFKPLPKYSADTLIRFDINGGPYAVHHDVIPYLDKQGVEFVAFFHTDLMIREFHWDEYVVGAFDYDPKLALIGFLGSNEIDQLGGRGLGTMSSFMGYEYKSVWASAAEVHGKRAKGLEPAAVLDHCSMIFRLSVLKEIPPASVNHVPFHFYDRIASVEVLNRGHRIAVYGLDADHASGGTGLSKARTEADKVELGVVNRNELYKKWFRENNIPFDEADENLDMVMYKEGERRFLDKWRDQLHFLPLKVNTDYSITHKHPHWRP